MNWIVSLLALFCLLVAVTRIRASLFTWTLVCGGLLLLLSGGGLLPSLLAIVLWPLFTVLALFNWTEVRCRFLSEPMLRYIRQALPPISSTEREAIEAGTTWWEAELFRGDPDWQRLLDVPAPGLTAAEQAYLDGPVEQLCAMLDDWQITHELNDLPREVWQFMARERFWAINIPEQYGGLAFSPEANSAIVMKIASRSGTAAVTVMVPNSLGPAELLLHYGTPAQKDHYLPRLASGEEIPCFGLTGPSAGSDAGAIPDYGVVCKGEYQGSEVLGLRVNWDKRYITLGPVATLLGLAFKAYDPDHLLGDREDLGITCALVPTDTTGVVIGARHYPLNSAFQNGPNSGRDVFIPMEWIIGGQEWLGKGWRMLMESLAAGRGISLPASGVAAAKLAARATGAYARVREQFNLPIGKFEGVEEALARIGGMTYMLDAARLLTTSALKLGEKPSVISAIVKYHLTEGARHGVNDAMDVHGGKAISMGPGNYLARAYQQLPLAITVEGANILTRSMIIFGQGAMRCHPYLLAEVAAAGDVSSDTPEFDRVLVDHLGYTATNAVRALVYGVSAARLAPAPPGREMVSMYYRGFARYSAAFALMADIALLVLGGDLKRREKLSGRLADALSYLYLGSAVLKHHEDSGRPAADQVLVDWACQHCLHEIQLALDGVLRNFPTRMLGALLRLLIFPLGRRDHGPDDRLGHAVAKLLLQPGASRDRLTAGIYLRDDPEDLLGSLEDGLHKVIAADPVRRRLRKGGHQRPPQLDFKQWVAQLRQQGLVDGEEARLLIEMQDATDHVIRVDEFPPRSTLADSAPEEDA